jgi:putative membrane-bound dehydrogenase-like protein
MSVPAGFRVELVCAEPQVRQPVAIDFDDRGRLWVLQYLQYPNPAGLKRVKVDRFSRTIYDRLPEPPPHGPRGADRLTILEPDPDKPGSMRSRDFIDGLNLASGFAFGHGGVFILQAPYLLFYPDRNRDDVPDTDPDVLLTGFGMEDAHSVANSLTWGPDGWLYGCQGSTVTANIRGIEFQQGVWRYHPLTRKFELFCEGGGNSWGLDFDRHGHLLYSTNHGGFTMLHGVQGGYYWKAFGKHGALHNPHAYGYFDHVPHENFRGGHVTVGGIIYRGDNFPERFRDRYIAADLLGHAVRWHDVIANGSSFKSRDAGELLLANDTWFAPSDVCLGPDGCVYVADWHDARMAHPDPDAEWDRKNGRVYRIAYGQPTVLPKFDLTTKSSAELVKLLAHPNDWNARMARHLLADRRDPEVILPLRTLIRNTDDDKALSALWALYVSGGFTETFARELLSHRNEHVRRWTVRLLGDEKQIGWETQRALERLAKDDPSPIVRSQLASTAKRLPAKQALPIVRAIMLRDEDGNDPHIPLLLWWAVEHHAIAGRKEVMAVFKSPDAWWWPLGRTQLLPRLVRRYVAEGSPAGDEACIAIIGSAPNDANLLPIWEPMEQGFRDRPSKAALDAEGLARLIREYRNRAPDELPLTRLSARCGDRAALDRLLSWAQDRKRPSDVRIAAINAYADVSPAGAGGTLMNLATGGDLPPVQLAALTGWARVGSAEEAAELVSMYSKLPVALQGRLRSVLLSRKNWAGQVLRSVDAGRIPVKDFTPDELFAVADHRDKELDALIRKHWGNVRGTTPEEKLAEVRRLNNDLRAGTGDLSAGRTLFTKHCATCHKLEGEGASLGPDLTHANRADRDYLLISLVDPSAVIRKEHLSHIAETKDNRLITGLITAQTPNTLTLTNAKGEATLVRRDDLVSLRESAVSLMPEGILKPLKPQELRDLFAYLQSPPPKR